MKEKILYDHLKRCRKTFKKFNIYPNPMIWEKILLANSRNRGKLSQTDIIYKKPTINIICNGERLHTAS